MARSSPPSPSKLFVSAVSVCILTISINASAIEFRVGGPKGWTVPSGNVSESYDHWARRNRFHIGDSLYFKYSNDSVLVVRREEYSNCNTTGPLVRFTDGNTTFRFDRYGFFYFISGDTGRCRSGQKLVVRVMVHPEHANLGPGPAPSPHTSGARDSGYGPSGEPSSSGALRVAAFGGGSWLIMITGLTVVMMMMMFI